MKLTAHVAISTAAAVAVYKITGLKMLSLSFFLSGIFIDLDHLLDYVLLSRERFSIRNFFSWYEERRWKKIYIIFHSYELLAGLLLAAVLARNEVLTGIAAGCSLHLLADQIGNPGAVPRVRLSPWFYSLSYRYFQRFEKEKLSEKC